MENEEGTVSSIHRTFSLPAMGTSMPARDLEAAAMARPQRRTWTPGGGRREGFWKGFWPRRREVRVMTERLRAWPPRPV